jgi:hypothetical protein
MSAFGTPAASSPSTTGRSVPSNCTQNVPPTHPDGPTPPGCVLRDGQIPGAVGILPPQQRPVDDELAARVVQVVDLRAADEAPDFGGDPLAGPFGRDRVTAGPRSTYNLCRPIETLSGSAGRR